MNRQTTSENDADAQTPWVNWTRTSLIVVVSGALLVVVAWYLLISDGDMPLPRDVTAEQYRTADRRFRVIYGRELDRVEVLLLMAEQAVATRDPETAVACFREIPSGNTKYGHSARLQEAQVLLQLNRADAAERSFREFLLIAATNNLVSKEQINVARKWLAYILSVELRLEDRKSVLAKTHVDRQEDLPDSKQFYFPNLLVLNSPRGRQRLLEFLAEDPENPRLNTALGRYHTMDGRVDDARALLEQLYKEYPNDLTCAAALLECCFEQDDWTRLGEIVTAISPYEQTEPWLLTRLRGRFALQHQKWTEAEKYFRCLLEADPADPACYMGLARALTALQRDDERDGIQKTSLVLARIRVEMVRVRHDNPVAAHEFAAACDQAGLRQAADTFQKHAVRIEQMADKAKISSGKKN